MNKAVASLANSEGWNCHGPIWIQFAAPPLCTPTKKTATKLRMPTTYSTTEKSSSTW
jgi:hypothetical protein